MDRKTQSLVCASRGPPCFNGRIRVFGDAMKPLKIFSARNCPRCVALKSYCQGHQISFDEVRLDPNAANYAELISDLRLDGCFILECPILQIDDIYYPPEAVFVGESMTVDEKWLRERLQ